ncbi:hypothetical protein, partial [Escherichia coli]|uniref:hypothetical protein n=1 Tax=Escherichia coli TaxID=562 RepID=UPI003F7597C2
YGHGACVEQDDKGWDARKRAYCLKIQPATGSFARNLIYSTKPIYGENPAAEEKWSLKSAREKHWKV